MALRPSSLIHHSSRLCLASILAAGAQPLLGEQAGLDALGQLDLLLGVEQGDLADLLQVVLDRVGGRARCGDLLGRRVLLVVVGEDEAALLLALGVALGLGVGVGRGLDLGTDDDDLDGLQVDLDDLIDQLALGGLGRTGLGRLGGPGPGGLRRALRSRLGGRGLAGGLRSGLGGCSLGGRGLGGRALGRRGGVADGLVGIGHRGDRPSRLTGWNGRGGRTAGGTRGRNGGGGTGSRDRRHGHLPVWRRRHEVDNRCGPPPDTSTRERTRACPDCGRSRGES